MTDNKHPTADTRLLPERFWSDGHSIYRSEYSVYRCDRETGAVMLAKNSPDCALFVRDDVSPQVDPAGVCLTGAEVEKIKRAANYLSDSSADYERKLGSDIWDILSRQPEAEIDSQKFKAAVANHFRQPEATSPASDDQVRQQPVAWQLVFGDKPMLAIRTEKEHAKDFDDLLPHGYTVRPLFAASPAAEAKAVDSTDTLATPEPGPAGEAAEAYIPGWARVVLMVSPEGKMHAIGGERSGEGDAPYIGLERIRALQNAPTGRTEGNSRARFEAWLDDQYAPDKAPRHIDETSGDYTWPQTQGHWKVWQAATSTPAGGVSLDEMLAKVPSYCRWKVSDIGGEFNAELGIRGLQKTYRATGPTPTAALQAALAKLKAQDAEKVGG